MAVVLFSAAFLATLIASRKSLGLGLSALLTVGYFSGVLRANYVSTFTLLMYDAAAAGVYTSFVLQRVGNAPGALQPLRGFTAALIAWPTLLLLMPIHDPLIQLVGWRAEVWLLPLILLGATLKLEDLRVLSLVVAILNLIALGAGVYLYFRGVEALYPQNAVTEIIYRSKDVTSLRYHRIPAIFLTAHAYGGTMVMSLPLLIGSMADRWITQGGKLVRVGGIVAALAGVMLCAARLPAAVLIVGIVICWCRSGISLRVLIWSGAAACVALAVAAYNPRLQRFFDLRDTDTVMDRAYVSAHEGVFALFLEYPLGAGLGAGAPSIPHFLANRAPPRIPQENEYLRIVIDLGWIGLGLWILFLIWLYFRVFRRSIEPSIYWMGLFAHGITLAGWGTAFIGSGLLVSIPSSSFLLIYMGIIAQCTTDTNREKHL